MKLAKLPILMLALVAASPAAVSLKSKDHRLPASVSDNNPVNPALKHFHGGRFTEAVSLAEPLAKAGNTDAVMLMAYAFETGRGVEASRDKAIEYYRMGRKGGSLEASYRLARLLVDVGGKTRQTEARKILEELSKTDQGTAARMLGEGALRGWFGGDPDYGETHSWWTKGASQGDVIAMLELGRLLDGIYGFPEKRDPAAALEQFVRAASLGEPAAMVAAGTRLLNGDESLRDEKKGLDWLAKALEEKQYDACLALGLHEERVSKNNKAALAHYRKGADNDQIDCMIKLGALLLAGDAGAKKDPDASLRWFKKAADAGNPYGHLQTARLLLKGEEPAKVTEAFTHLIAAAETGIAGAQNEVGLLYLSGRLGFRDPTAAAGWFSRASTAGLAEGSRNLAELYERGLGVPQDFNQAGQLYTRAASFGHPQATTALGRLHEKGIGTEKNLTKAWAFYMLASELGDKNAREPLDKLTSGFSKEQIAEGRKAFAGFKTPRADGSAADPARRE